MNQYNSYTKNIFCIYEKKEKKNRPEQMDWDEKPIA